MESKNQETRQVNGSIGIDLGASQIKAAFLDPEGSLHVKTVDPTDKAHDYKTITRQLITIINDIRLQTETEVAAVGIGVAGSMNRVNRQVVFSPNLDILNGKALADDVQDESGIAAFMDNDANCMAIGEGNYGAARNCSHYISITVGTGIGGALISDGRIIRGWEGGGGEVGHITINPDGPQCTCGARGCLETYAGQKGILRWLSENYPDSNNQRLKDVITNALSGSRPEQEVFNHVGRMLGIGVSGLVNLFNPEMIIIGGGISVVGDLLFIPLRTEIENRAFKSYTKHLEIKPAELGNWAGVAGAAKMALDRVIS